MDVKNIILFYWKAVCEHHRTVDDIFADSLSEFVVVTDAVDAVYKAEDDKRHILVTILPGQRERQTRLHFRCSNTCCEYLCDE